MNVQKARKLTTTARNKWWEGDEAEAICSEITLKITDTTREGGDSVSYELYGKLNWERWHIEMIVEHFEETLGFDVEVEHGDAYGPEEVGPAARITIGWGSFEDLD